MAVPELLTLDIKGTTIAMNFAEQIWLSIVDKILLGGLVALVGYYGTRAIEAYKAKQLLRTELTKQRVLKIEDVWKRLLDIQALADSFRTSLVPYWISRAIGKPEDQLRESRELWLKLVIGKQETVDEIKAKFDEMVHSIERDSFWLGRDLTKKATAQLASVRSAFETLVSGDTIELRKDGTIGFTTTITKHVVDVDYILDNV